MARLAAHERQGQFFVSIGSLHNFCFVFLSILTKENFPKPLDFLCKLWYTCIIKREEKHMMVAIIILAALLSFQFVSAIKQDCMKLGLMFGVEIILFAYIAKNFI